MGPCARVYYFVKGLYAESVAASEIALREVFALPVFSNSGFANGKLYPVIAFAG